MSVSVFHAGAGEYGVLTSTMALGSVAGALLAAGRERRRPGLLSAGAALFGVACALGALMPNYWLFGLTLILAGASAQTVTTTVNSTVQLTTEPAMRGRVVAILLAVMLGGTPIGAPIVGWVADRFGPRWALGVGAASGFVAAVVGVRYLVKYRNLRLRTERGRIGFSIRDA
jgi:MFS family permease